MMPKKKVIVLGATGSIGSSTLDIIRTNSDLFTVVALSAHTGKDALHRIADEFKVDQTILSSVSGQSALCDMIRNTEADIVVNGIAGSAGLLPSVATLESNKDLALANKETIVMAGLLVRDIAEKKHKKILPVDSEHSAVFNLIHSVPKNSVAEIILTASGGPFRTWETDKLATARPEDALKHPTWSMGSKITIDSASLANKGLEVIEACRLFDISVDAVKVVIHPQSLIHSLIRTVDGVLYAQLSHPDMRHPILSALSWPHIISSPIEPLTFDSAMSMTFEPPRRQDFPLLGLAYRAAALKGGYTIAYNASNEIAVEAFLKHSISFPSLAQVTATVLEFDWTYEPRTIEDVLEIDRKARSKAETAVKDLSC